MWKMPILPKTGNAVDNCSEFSSYYHSIVRPLPLCYMSDYSVVGLRVEKHEEAIRLLEENRFHLNESAEVVLDGPPRLHHILRLFAGAGITWEIADTVSGIYQG